MTKTNSNFPKSSKKSSKEHVAKLIGLASRRTQKRLLKPGTYLKYMDYLKTKPIQAITEKHHILPIHMGGTDEPSNLIRIAVRDHILAHLLLYLEEGGRGNLLAYSLRKASEHVDLKSQSQKIAFMNRTLKKGWWDSEVQRELGLRGGSKGGSKNTEAQWAARSLVGQTWGRSVGLSRQSVLLKERLSTTIVFKHKLAPVENPFSETILVPPQESVVGIAEYINEECDRKQLSTLKLNLDRIKRGGPFYGLIKGTKKSAYGWFIVDMFPDEAFDD